MKKLLLPLAIALLCGSTLLAQEISTITLKDKTVVRGEVMGMNKGVYSIKTGSLGTIEIPAKQVVSIVLDEPQSGFSGKTEPAPTKQLKNTAVAIREGHAKKPKAPNGNPVADPETYGDADESSQAPADRLQKDASGRVQSMMMNEDFSQKVMGISENSEMEAVLNDPETMEAIRNNDYQSLMNNEKMKKLMESSGMRNILGDFEE